MSEFIIISDGGDYDLTIRTTDDTFLEIEANLPEFYEWFPISLEQAKDLVEFLNEKINTHESKNNNHATK